MSEEQKPITCPKCAEPISINLVAKAKAQSKMSFRLSPGQGELLDIQTFAQSAGAFGKLLVGIGRDIGVNTVVLVERLVTEDDGSLRVDVLIARSDTKTKKQLLRKATRDADAPVSHRAK